MSIKAKYGGYHLTWIDTIKTKGLRINVYKSRKEKDYFKLANTRTAL